MNATDLVKEGRQAFDGRSWMSAYAALLQADQQRTLAPDDLQRLAVAAHLVGKPNESADIWARAHHEYLRHGKTLEAVRCAFWLGFTFLFRDEQARSSGWLARGHRLLERAPGETAESGYLLFADALRRFWGGDPEGAHAAFQQAAEIGTKAGDADLQALGRLGFGETSICLGRLREGVALLDEVMAAVLADEVSTLAVGVIYCAVLGVCHRTFDLRRAREWTAAFNRWCESQPDLVPYRGECMVQRAEILQQQGAWPLAMAEARRACELPSEGGYQAWIGEAYYKQGDLHRLRGDFAKAEQAYKDASRFGVRSQPGLALLRLAQGRIEPAVAAVSRSLVEDQDDSSRWRILPAHVEIMLAAADDEAAATAARELASIAAASDAPYLQALAEEATGRVLLHRGDTAAALTQLRAAESTLLQLDTPYELARVRVLLGICCSSLGDADSAFFAFDAARECFERLDAMPDLTAVNRQLRTPAGHSVAGLTDREVEVLRLVARGSSNRAIAEELVLSEHTVRRHLQNLFAKLGVSSRSAATAFAYEQGLV
jgi:ATP/maltotriose-dependent transcriptional regulator MalT